MASTTRSPWPSVTPPVPAPPGRGRPCPGMIAVTCSGPLCLGLQVDRVALGIVQARPRPRRRRGAPDSRPAPGGSTETSYGPGPRSMDRVEVRPRACWTSTRARRRRDGRRPLPPARAPPPPRARAPPPGPAVFMGALPTGRPGATRRVRRCPPARAAGTAGSRRRCRWATAAAMAATARSRRRRRVRQLAVLLEETRCGGPPSTNAGWAITRRWNSIEVGRPSTRHSSSARAMRAMASAAVGPQATSLASMGS